MSKKEKQTRTFKSFEEAREASNHYDLLVREVKRRHWLYGELKKIRAPQKVLECEEKAIAKFTKQRDELKERLDRFYGAMRAFLKMIMAA